MVSNLLLEYVVFLMRYVIVAMCLLQCRVFLKNVGTLLGHHRYCGAPAHPQRPQVHSKHAESKGMGGAP